MRKNYFSKLMAGAAMFLSVSFGLTSCDDILGEWDRPPPAVVEEIVELIVTKTGATPSEVTAAIKEALSDAAVQKAISTNQPIKITITDNSNDGDGVEASTSDQTITIPVKEGLNVELIFSQAIAGTSATTPLNVVGEGTATENGLTVSMPDVATANGITINIDLPNTTVTLVTNGTETVYNSVTAKTAANTLIVEEGVVIEDLKVEAGNVVINGGKVKLTEIAEGSKVTIKSGELTIASGVNISELDYQGGDVIDEDGKAVLGGTTLYASIEDAQTAGETEVTLLADFTGKMSTIKSGTFTLNLNDKTFTCQKNDQLWSSYSGIRVKAADLIVNAGDNGKIVFESGITYGFAITGDDKDQGTDNLTINGGTYECGNAAQGIYFWSKNQGKLSIKDATLNSTYNAGSYTMFVYFRGGIADLENTTINTQASCCFDAEPIALYKDGTSEPYYPYIIPETKATIKNCTFTNNTYVTYTVGGTEYKSHWIATAVACSFGAEVTIDGGTYTGKNYGAYVFSSGGTMNLKSGTFKGSMNSLRADKDNSGTVNIGNSQTKSYADFGDSYIYYSPTCTLEGETKASNENCHIEQKNF